MKDKNKTPLNKAQAPEGQPPSARDESNTPAENSVPEEHAEGDTSQPNADASHPKADTSQPQVPMVAMTMEEYDALQRDLEQARAKSAEYFDGWQRERADFLNYKKRVDRDSAQVYQNALASILKKYLVILDDLDRALKSPAAKSEDAHWAKGIELIEHKLLKSIEAEGITRMPFAGNEVFDPTRHEAISYEDNPDHQSGQIIEVLQPGYLIGDRVLRPALVRVAR